MKTNDNDNIGYHLTPAERYIHEWTKLRPDQPFCFLDFTDKYAHGTIRNAFLRLKNLSGKKYEFYTGVYMVNTSTRTTILKVVKSEIFMRELSDIEIKKYLDQDQHYNTYALGYDPLENISSSFIQKLFGSYNNVLRGIPLEVLPEMLSEVGYKF